MDSSSLHEPGIFRRFGLPVLIFGALALNAVLLVDSYQRNHPTDPGRTEGEEPAATAARPGPDRGTIAAGQAPLDDSAAQRDEGATSPPASPASPTDRRGGAASPTRRYTWLAEGGRPVAEEPGGSPVIHETTPQVASAKARALPPARGPVEAPRGQVGPAGVGNADLGRVASPPPPARTDTDKPKPPADVDEAPTDPSSDRKPPVLLSLRLDPPQVNDGSATNLLIEMSDDLSGVKSVAGRFRSPSGKALIPFEAQGAAGNPLYTAPIRIPAKGETGYWYLSDLIAYDQANNPLIANFSAATSPPGGRLLVSSADSDSSPPTVRDIRVDPPTVRGGETATLRIDIEDDMSGVASIWGTFRSHSGAGTLNFSARPAGGQNVPGPGPSMWDGVVPIPANADCGEWNLQQLVVADKAGNSARLAEETAPVARTTFYVSSDSCDSAAPVLESLTLSPTIVSNESATEVLLTASVSDEGTGATAMLISIVGPASTNGQAPRISVQGVRASNDPAALWNARIPVPQFAAKGIWRVAFVRLQDRASNIRDYKSDDQVLVNATFEVR